MNSHDMPPPLEGINMEALPTLIGCLTFAGQHGYDPQTDYRMYLNLSTLKTSP